jgi:hypothetical protein
MWPAFIAAVIAEAVLGHLLPWSGDSSALAAAGLQALVLNTIGVVALARPLGLVLRRRRRDLPLIVARDYAGTSVVAVIAVLLVLAAVSHHGTIMAHRNAREDAIVRAQAFIGDHAPAEFRGNVQWVSMFTIQSGSLYRACVPSAATGRTYCVIVDTRKPFAHSVNFDGYEPNSVFSSGIDGF